MFEPKRILDEGDWLAVKKELGQTFEEFLKSPTRNNITPKRSKIYLKITDPSISEDFA